MENSDLSFDDLKARLDEIVKAISDDSLPLEEALDLYEEAVGIGLQASRVMEEGIAARDAQTPSSDAAQEGNQSAQGVCAEPAASSNNA